MVNSRELENVYYRFLDYYLILFGDLFYDRRLFYGEFLRIVLLDFRYMYFDIFYG